MQIKTIVLMVSAVMVAVFAAGSMYTVDEGERAVVLRYGEVNSVAEQGQAMRDNPNIVTLLQAEKWDGKLPTTMLPNQAVPMINATPSIGHKNETPNR